MAIVRGVWVRLALLASVLTLAWFLAAAFGTKYGALDWRTGFETMTLKLGPLLLWGAAGFALIGLLLAMAVAPRRGRAIALAALLIPAAGLGYTMYLGRLAPSVHDVSTDAADPPAFDAAVLDARARVGGGDAHGVGHADIAPLITDTPAFDAFQVALDTAENQPGWVVDGNDPATGVIAARTTNFWYGFTDDIAIRVRRLPDDSGTTIDMRSAARVASADYGANARRVRAYMHALNANLGQAATGG